jgi:hypothetical protein
MILVRFAFFSRVSTHVSFTFFPPHKKTLPLDFYFFLLSQHDSIANEFSNHQNHFAQLLLVYFFVSSWQPRLLLSLMPFRQRKGKKNLKIGCDQEVSRPKRRRLKLGLNVVRSTFRKRFRFAPRGAGVVV